MSPVNRFDERGPADLLRQGHSARLVGRAAHRPPGALLRRADPQLRRRRRRHQGVRLRQGTGQRVHHVPGPRRRVARQPVAPRAVRLVLRRRQAADQQQRHRRRAASCFAGSIQERISRIAPFLRLDRDPYLVVNDGRLVWLQDAYTTSDALPYSQPSRRGGINYIRNAVKIAVDAYDGTLDVLRQRRRRTRSCAPTSASSRRCSSRSTRMPAGLRQHLRYPEDLFLLQASMYGTYHMTDPEVFYNKEDLWSFPQESYSGAAGHHAAVLHDHAPARRGAARSSSSCCRWCRTSATT